MRIQSFSDCLINELASIRYSLIPLYEKKDKLLYVDAAALRNEYIEKIGHYEESVLQAELEVALLREKLKDIQIAINRREPVDMVEIEAKVQEKKEQMVSSIERQDLTLHELPELSDKERDSMQRIYRGIIDEYHPALNSNLTDTQKELYEQAMKAYQHQNLQELALINDMLHAGEQLDLNLKFSVSETEKDDTDEVKKRKESYKRIAQIFSTDYSLAKTLFPYFEEQENDDVILSNIAYYISQKTMLEEEIKQIQSGFPFNAKEVLRSPVKTEEYLVELRVRSKAAEVEKGDLEQRIEKLIGVAQNG